MDLSTGLCCGVYRGSEAPAPMSDLLASPVPV